MNRVFTCYFGEDGVSFNSLFFLIFYRSFGCPKVSILSLLREALLIQYHSLHFHILIPKEGKKDVLTSSTSPCDSKWVIAFAPKSLQPCILFST